MLLQVARDGAGQVLTVEVDSAPLPSLFLVDSLFLVEALFLEDFLQIVRVDLERDLQHSCIEVVLTLGGGDVEGMELADAAR